jgi:hypothetical protein
MDSATETQIKSVDVLVSPKEKAPEVKSFEDIIKVCRDIVAELPEKPRGQTTEEFLKHLKARSRQYKILRSFYSKERAGKRLPKAKEEKLQEAGLTTENIPEENAIVSANLLDAYYLTYKLLHSTDPRKTMEKKSPAELEYVTLGVKANIALTDFFIDLHERFDLNQHQLETVFRVVFDNSPLASDLQAKGFGRFKDGIVAAIKGYLYLSKTRPDCEIRTPDIELDRDHAIDLVAIPKNGGAKSYYQIKSVREGEINVKDITNPKEMENVRKELVLSADRRSSELRSLGSIFDYVTRQKGAKAFWVRVPV